MQQMLSDYSGFKFDVSNRKQFEEIDKSVGISNVPGKKSQGKLVITLRRVKTKTQHTKTYGMRLKPCSKRGL